MKALYRQKRTVWARVWKRAFPCFLLFYVTAVLAALSNRAYAQIVIAQQDFDSVTSWGYSTAGSTADAITTVTNSLSPLTLGAGYTLNHTAGGSKAFLKSDACCSTGGTSMSVGAINFNVVNITGYANPYIEFFVSSISLAADFGICTPGQLLCTQLDASVPCSPGSVGGGGNGMDVNDGFRAFVSINGAPEIQILTYTGNADQKWTYSGGTYRTIAYPTPLVLSGGSNFGGVRINLPAGTSAAIRFELASNRRNEIWALDDVSLFNDVPLFAETLALKTIFDEQNNEYLKWQTVNSQDFIAFVVEKTLDGKVFSEIARLSSHSFDYLLTAAERKGNCAAYYRVRGISEDNQDHLSNLVRLRRPAFAAQKLVISPNPAEDLIRIENITAEKLQATDGQGRVWSLIDTGSASWDVSALPSGLYFLQARGENGERFVGKMLKK